MKTIFSRSKARPVTYRTCPVDGWEQGSEVPVSDRQDKIPGFKGKVLRDARVSVTGLGGVGTWVAQGLARKGVGTLVLLDHDIVEPTNLPRQFYYKEDLYKPKAYSLARNLRKEACLGTTIVGYHLSFQDALSRGIDLGASVAVVAVDSNRGRIAASTYYREHQTPVIFCAVAADGSHGFVFVQEPGQGCFACLKPDAVTDLTAPCPGTPAILDIHPVATGLALYAVDSVLMPRPRRWHYKDVYLATGDGLTFSVPRKLTCALCGQGNAAEALIGDERV
jgi:molybdopterin/thiamine biosynthesis adenylyltransferase